MEEREEERDSLTGCNIPEEEWEKGERGQKTRKAEWEAEGRKKYHLKGSRGRDTCRNGPRDILTQWGRRGSENQECN